MQLRVRSAKGERTESGTWSRFIPALRGGDGDAVVTFQLSNPLLREMFWSKRTVMIQMRLCRGDSGAHARDRRSFLKD